MSLIGRASAAAAARRPKLRRKARGGQGGRRSPRQRYLGNGAHRRTGLRNHALAHPHRCRVHGGDIHRTRCLRSLRNAPATPVAPEPPGRRRCLHLRRPLPHADPHGPRRSAHPGISAAAEPRLPSLLCGYPDEEISKLTSRTPAPPAISALPSRARAATTRSAAGNHYRCRR